MMGVLWMTPRPSSRYDDLMKAIEYGTPKGVGFVSSSASWALDFLSGRHQKSKVRGLFHHP